MCKPYAVTSEWTGKLKKFVKPLTRFDINFLENA